MIFRPVSIKMEKSNKRFLIILIIGTIFSLLGIITGTLWITHIYDWAITKVLLKENKNFI